MRVLSFRGRLYEIQEPTLLSDPSLQVIDTEYPVIKVETGYNVQGYSFYLILCSNGQVWSLVRGIKDLLDSSSSIIDIRVQGEYLYLITATGELHRYWDELRLKCRTEACWVQFQPRPKSMALLASGEERDYRDGPDFFDAIPDLLGCWLFSDHQISTISGEVRFSGVQAVGYLSRDQTTLLVFLDATNRLQIWSDSIRQLEVPGVCQIHYGWRSVIWRTETQVEVAWLEVVSPSQVALRRRVLLE